MPEGSPPIATRSPTVRARRRARVAPFLRVRRVEGAPVVAVRLWLWGGSGVEDVPGQAWVTGRMLAEGTAPATGEPSPKRASPRA